LFKPLLLIPLLFLLSAPVNADDTQAKQIEKALGIPPKYVIVEGSNLIIAFNERRINAPMYEGTIAYLCALSEVDKVDLNGIAIIAIVNEYGRQGFVFELINSSCKVIANTGVNDLGDVINATTHLWSRTGN